MSQPRIEDLMIISCERDLSDTLDHEACLLPKETFS